MRLLVPAGPPQNQREEREEDEESEDESEDVALARNALVVRLAVEQPFLLDHRALLPRLVALAAAAPSGPVIRQDLPGPGLQRPGEPAGGGVPGVAADGRVGVRGGVGRAEDGAGVERRRRLFAVMGVTRRALHVVHRPGG